jgi:hypothetical protein
LSDSIFTDAEAGGVAEGAAELVGGVVGFDEGFEVGASSSDPEEQATRTRARTA